ncbi:MAG: hypothetical protein ACI9TA_002428, partial [Reinekea sp.]
MPDVSLQIFQFKERHIMTTVSSTYFRLVSVTVIVAMSLLWNTTLRAQTNALPNYVIEQFGTPPAIPDVPLSAALLASMQTAFVVSMSDGIWGSDQTIALTEITASGDPRLVWLISDLMRFAPDRALNRELSNA